jgi:hypothetical protein
MSRLTVKHSLLFITFLLAGLFACKHTPNEASSKTIDQLVKEIAEDNVFKGPAVGIAGVRPEQWNRYEGLRLRATETELLKLVNNENAVVRCYAFQALAGRNRNALFPVALQHLSDTTEVDTIFGCEGGSQKVGDFFLETVIGNQGNGTFNQLTKKQKETIDSLLIFERKNKLVARDALLSEVFPSQKYYRRIRQMATEENNKMAVVALSKYKNQQDKLLIEQLLKAANNQTYGFAAVANFPDRSFFPILQQTLKNEVTKGSHGNDERLQLLYEAMVQYKDSSSRQLLQWALYNAKGMQSIYHYDYLHQALKKFPAEIYTGLLKPIHIPVPAEKSEL